MPLNNVEAVFDTTGHISTINYKPTKGLVDKTQNRTTSIITIPEDLIAALKDQSIPFKETKLKIEEYLQANKVKAA